MTRSAENLPGKLECFPLTMERWADFERLFGPRGACAGCWCMWWRQSTAQFNRDKGEPNRDAMRALVAANRVPGLLGYVEGEAAGWCSLAPRGEFPRLARSRLLQPLDDTPVWSLVCLFVARPYRRRGLSVQLIRAAMEYAAAQGASVLEAYPVLPASNKAPDIFLYPGTPAAYERAGFSRAATPSPRRMIVRASLGDL